MRICYLLFCLIPFFCACDKGPEVEQMMNSKSVTLKDATFDANEYLKFSAEIHNIRKEELTEYGFVYTYDGTGPLLDHANKIPFIPGRVPADTKFEGSIDASIPDAEYAIRAYVILNGDVFYSNTYRYKSAPRGSWKRLNNFPGPARSFAVSFSLDGRGYTGLGWGAGNSLKDFWQFDPVTNEWKQLPDFPGEARSSAIHFVIGDKAYVGGGTPLFPATEYVYSGFNDFYEFNPATGAWKKLADVPGFQTYPGGVFGAYSFAAGGFGFIGGGRDNTYMNYHIFKYDPLTNIWTPEAEQRDQHNKLNPVIFGSCFVINDTAYIGGGIQDFRRPETTSEYFTYYHKWKKWERIIFPGIKRAYAFGASNSNTGLVGFGEQTQEIWQITPSSRWKPVSRCPDYYFNKSGIAFTIGNKSYIGLGTTVLPGHDEKTIYEYTHTR